MNMQIRAVISGLIGSLGVTCALAQTAPSSTDDAWHFAVTPYLISVSLSPTCRTLCAGTQSGPA